MSKNKKQQRDTSKISIEVKDSSIDLEKFRAQLEDAAKKIMELDKEEFENIEKFLKEFDDDDNQKPGRTP